MAIQYDANLNIIQTPPAAPLCTVNPVTSAETNPRVPPTGTSNVPLNGLAVPISSVTVFAGVSPQFVISNPA